MEGSSSDLFAPGGPTEVSGGGCRLELRKRESSSLRSRSEKDSEPSDGMEDEPGSIPALLLVTYKKKKRGRKSSEKEIIIRVNVIA